MVDGLMSFLRAGGIMMVPLTLIGVMIFASGLYQLIWLTMWLWRPERYSCHGAPFWAAKAQTLARSRTGWQGLSLLESIELCLAKTEHCLTRRVPTMRFFAQISTLFGFLGTVTGMVQVFQTVALRGVVTPKDLAGGIYEALFTTVYGLVLALIAYGLAHFIESLARQHLNQLEMQVLQELDSDASPSHLPEKGQPVTGEEGRLGKAGDAP